MSFLEFLSGMNYFIQKEKEEKEEEELEWEQKFDSDSYIEFHDEFDEYEF